MSVLLPTAIASNLYHIVDCQRQPQAFFTYMDFIDSFMSLEVMCLYTWIPIGLYEFAHVTLPLPLYFHLAIASYKRWLLCLILIVESFPPVAYHAMIRKSCRPWPSLVTVH